MCFLSFSLSPLHCLYLTPKPQSLLSPSTLSSLNPVPSSLILATLFFSLPISVRVPSAGTTSRRCSLDHRGMAFWEQPSYARCITNEFRYLQQSVGAKSAPFHSLCFQCIINYLPGVFPFPHYQRTVAKDYPHSIVEQIKTLISPFFWV